MCSCTCICLQVLGFVCLSVCRPRFITSSRLHAALQCDEAFRHGFRFPRRWLQERYRDGWTICPPIRRVPIFVVVALFVVLAVSVAVAVAVCGAVCAIVLMCSCSCQLPSPAIT